MQPESSFSCSQKPAIGSEPELFLSGLEIHILFLWYSLIFTSDLVLKV
jgi:hypothetical protein